MNIQDYKEAIKLTEYMHGHDSRYVYCVQKTGMLYEVDPADGTITGEKYILNISFSPLAKWDDGIREVDDAPGAEDYRTHPNNPDYQQWKLEHPEVNLYGPDNPEAEYSDVEQLDGE